MALSLPVVLMPVSSSVAASFSMEAAYSAVEASFDLLAGERAEKGDDRGLGALPDRPLPGPLASGAVEEGASPAAALAAAFLAAPPAVAAASTAALLSPPLAAEEGGPAA